MKVFHRSIMFASMVILSLTASMASAFEYDSGYMSMQSTQAIGMTASDTGVAAGKTTVLASVSSDASSNCVTCHSSPGTPQPAMTTDKKTMILSTVDIGAGLDTVSDNGYKLRQRS